MNKIFIVAACILSLMSCGKRTNGNPDVQELLKDMKSMTVEERGKAFAENVVKYMDAKDSVSMKTLQDSTYAWACTLYEPDKKVFEKAVKDVYRSIIEKKMQETGQSSTQRK